MPKLLVIKFSTELFVEQKQPDMTECTICSENIFSKMYAVTLGMTCDNKTDKIIGAVLCESCWDLAPDDLKNKLTTK